MGQNGKLDLGSIFKSNKPTFVDQQLEDAGLDTESIGVGGISPKKHQDRRNQALLQAAMGAMQGQQKSNQMIDIGGGFMQRAGGDLGNAIQGGLGGFMQAQLGQAAKAEAEESEKKRQEFELDKLMRSIRSRETIAGGVQEGANARSVGSNQSAMDRAILGSATTQSEGQANRDASAARQDKDLKSSLDKLIREQDGINRRHKDNLAQNAAQFSATDSRITNQSKRDHDLEMLKLGVTSDQRLSEAVAKANKEQQARKDMLTDRGIKQKHHEENLALRERAIKLDEDRAASERPEASSGAYGRAYNAVSDAIKTDDDQILASIAEGVGLYIDKTGKVPSKDEIRKYVKGEKSAIDIVKQSPETARKIKSLFNKGE